MPMQRYKPEQIVTVLRQIEAAMANGKSTPPGLQGGWDPYADVLSVAEGVWRSEGGAGQTAEGVGEGKHPVETTGSRAVAGEADVKGGLSEEISRSEFSNGDRELGRPS